MFGNRLALGFLAGSLVLAAPLHVRQSAFVAGSDGLPSGWTQWSARAETAPRAFVDPSQYRTQPGSLAISGNGNASEHGGWHYQVPGIEPEKSYRFAGYYKSAGVRTENWQIEARLDWRRSDGKRAAEPESVSRAVREGTWTKVSLETQAPADASAVVIELYLSNAPLATVWWDDISLEQIPDKQPRNVTVASVNYIPVNAHSSEESVRQFLNVADQAVGKKADIILLSEAITQFGTGKTYFEASEPVPGPTTAKLGTLALSKDSYVVAGIIEREGTTIYNTAVLIDRAGKLAGKYRKVHLPRGEVEGGLTPGNDYPVFKTDFGTVGLMVCYDVFFADPARALTIKGSEIILMPIEGGVEPLGKARAIENRVFLAAAGSNNYPTYILDPDGEILAEAKDRGSAAIATIDLNKRYIHPHRGDMRQRYTKELRLDIPVGDPGFAEFDR
jgi:predicted amidohydrolase